MIDTVEKPRSSGWVGDTFYPDGPGKPGVKVRVLPADRAGNSEVEHVKVIPGNGVRNLTDNPAVDPVPVISHPVIIASGKKHAQVKAKTSVRKKGRPSINLSPVQLSYLNSDLSVRKAAKAMGVSKTVVNELRKKGGI